MKRVASLLFIFITISCSLEPGGQGSYIIKNIGDEMVDYASYSTRDRDIATKICYAFQSKRSNFLGNYNGDTFRFDIRVENLDCKTDLISKMIDTVLVARSLTEPMLYDGLTSRSEFDPYLQTNANGYLSQICDLVMRGDELPTPTIEYGSYKRTQILFFENQDDIGFIYSIYHRDYDSEEVHYTLSEQDYLTVLIDPSEELYGIVLERVHEKKCDGPVTEKKSQLYIPSS